MRSLTERLREAAENGRSPIGGHLHVEDRMMLEAADRIATLEAALEIANKSRERPDCALQDRIAQLEAELKGARQVWRGRIEELAGVLDDIASRTDWSRDDCGKAAAAVLKDEDFESETPAKPPFYCAYCGKFLAECFAILAGSSVETPANPSPPSFSGWMTGPCEHCGKPRADHPGIEMRCPQETKDVFCPKGHRMALPQYGCQVCCWLPEGYAEWLGHIEGEGKLLNVVKQQRDALEVQCVAYRKRISDLEATLRTLRDTVKGLYLPRNVEDLVLLKQMFVGPLQAAEDLIGPMDKQCICQPIDTNARLKGITWINEDCPVHKLRSL